MVSDLHLAVDCGVLGHDGTGNETYWWSLLTGLLDGLGPSERLTLLGDPKGIGAVGSDRRVQVCPVRPGRIGDLTMGWHARRAGANSYLGNWVAPIGFRGVVASVIHDVAWRRVPDTFPAVMRARLGVQIAYTNHRSDMIVTSSSFSAEELATTRSLNSPKNTMVVSPGVPAPHQVPVTATAVAELKDRFELPDRFALTVGSLQPRKNLTTMATAAQQADIPLYAVGKPVWGNSDEVPPSVHWLGRLDDSELRVLYSAAPVFIYLSTYEGFGLPVLEAMAAGCPVVCSSTSSLPEAAGGAALLVDPMDVAAAADALLEAADNGEMREASTKRAARAGTHSDCGPLLDWYRSQLRNVV